MEIDQAEQIVSELGIPNWNEHFKLLKESKKWQERKTAIETLKIHCESLGSCMQKIFLI